MYMVCLSLKWVEEVSIGCEEDMLVQFRGRGDFQMEDLVGKISRVPGADPEQNKLVLTGS